MSTAQKPTSNLSSSAKHAPAGASPSRQSAPQAESEVGLRGVNKTVQRLLQNSELPDGFQPITEAEEDRLMVKAVAVDREMLTLFRAHGSEDLLTFIRFARALSVGNKC